MTRISSMTDPQAGLRFHRTMKDAYGYDARLERTPPIRSRSHYIVPALVAALLLLAVLVAW